MGDGGDAALGLDHMIEAFAIGHRAAIEESLIEIRIKRDRGNAKRDAKHG